MAGKIMKRLKDQYLTLNKLQEGAANVQERK